MPKLKEKLKDFGQLILLKSRYTIVLAIISTMLSSIFLFFWTMMNFTLFLKEGHFGTEKEVIISIVSGIDLFLLGVITLIVSFSLYEMYIKDENSKIKVPKPLIVNNLEELKEKLTSVVLIILIITYFKYSINFEYDEPMELLAFAVGIFFISMSIHFTKKKKD